MPVSDRDDALEQLGAGLADALADRREPSSVLAALIEVDPGLGAEWLLEDGERARHILGDEALSSLVEASVRRCGLADEAARSVAVRLLEAYSDDVSVDLAVEVLGALGAAERAGRAGLIGDWMERWPNDARLLRFGVEASSASGDSDALHSRLDRLSRLDESQATIQWIHRMRGESPAAPGDTVRVSLLSSFTIDPLVPYLDLELRRLGLEPDLEIAPFNSWAQEIIGTDSGLRRFDPEVAFLSVSIDDLVPGLAGALSEDELQRDGDEAVERLSMVAKAFSEWSDGLLVVHGFHSAYRDPFGSAAGRGAPDRNAWLSRLNLALEAELQDLPRVRVLDLADLLLRRAGGAYDNPKMRLLAGMRVIGPALADVACAYAGYVSAARGMTCKCVVVDLDNTLWGGIVGEDGPTGIRLGTTAPGVEYQEFQRYLLSLTRRGILIAINSKNNAEDALEVIRSHPEMVLREDSFSAMRINWLPKPENILEIASELNIGVDSMVFVDDNPNERELMRQMLPGVLTPELPGDPALYRTTLEALPQLQSLVITDVDLGRVEQYQSKREREALKSTSGSLESYLSSLDIAVVIDQANETTLPRTHQLFQRTNQFNLTTRRHEAGLLEARAAAPDWRLYTLRARDRFGDHGLVATALVRIDDRVWTIDSFLMSCRVISYGIETALLHSMLADARDSGADTVVGEYIETPKNSPARGLYEKHGFASNGGSDGVEHWKLELAAGDVAAPDWIQLERGDS